MERLRHKSKKEPPIKYVEKDKTNSFITDMKSMKENLKIKEILRNVKMNSSMRIKAPRGSKIMQNKDFNDNDEFDEVQNIEETGGEVPPSATNPELIKTTDMQTEHVNETLKENCVNDLAETINVNINSESNIAIEPENSVQNEETRDVSASDDLPTEIIKIFVYPPMEVHITNSDSEPIPEQTHTQIVTESEPSCTNDPSATLKITKERPLIQSRERKLSLDQTMLNRRESFSQSELDLHSIGKSPLEKKSSFFRKKMDSFFKNTMEIFKKQSLGSNSQLGRRGSMSLSLQSLSETSSSCNNEPHELHRDIVSSS